MIIAWSALWLFSWLKDVEPLCSPTSYYRNCWIRRFPGLSIAVEESRRRGATLLELYQEESALKCSRACCLATNFSCNLAVYHYNTTQDSANCFHFHCPTLESCILHQRGNVILYNVTKGVDPDLLVFGKHFTSNFRVLPNHASSRLNISEPVASDKRQFNRPHVAPSSSTNTSTAATPSTSTYTSTLPDVHISTPAVSIYPAQDTTPAAAIQRSTLKNPTQSSSTHVAANHITHPTSTASIRWTSTAQQGSVQPSYMSQTAIQAFSTQTTLSTTRHTTAHTTASTTSENTWQSATASTKSQTIHPSISSTTSEHTLQSTTSEHTLQSTTSENTLQSTTSEHTLQSTTSESTLQSTTSENTLQSTTLSTTIQTILASAGVSITSQNNLESTTASATSENTLESTTASTTSENTLESTTASTTSENTVESTTTSTTSENTLESTTTSTTSENTLESTTTSTTSQNTLESTTASTTSQNTLESTTASTTSQNTLESTTASTTSENTLESTTTSTTSENTLESTTASTTSENTLESTTASTTSQNISTKSYKNILTDSSMSTAFNSKPPTTRPSSFINTHHSTAHSTTLVSNSHTVVKSQHITTQPQISRSKATVGWPYSQPTNTQNLSQPPQSEESTTQDRATFGQVYTSTTKTTIDGSTALTRAPSYAANSATTSLTTGMEDSQPYPNDTKGYISRNITTGDSLLPGGGEGLTPGWHLAANTVLVALATCATVVFGCCCSVLMAVSWRGRRRRKGRYRTTLSGKRGSMRLIKYVIVRESS